MTFEKALYQLDLRRELASKAANAATDEETKRVKRAEANAYSEAWDMVRELREQVRTSIYRILDEKD
jgi:hypothetical protein